MSTSSRPLPYWASIFGFVCAGINGQVAVSALSFVCAGGGGGGLATYDACRNPLWGVSDLSMSQELDNSSLDH